MEQNHINLVCKIVKKKIGNILKIVIPLALGAVILFWIYKDFDFSRVHHAVCNEMNIWWFIASLFFGIISHVIRGLRWRLVLEPLGYHPRSSDCIYSIFIAYAANLVIPRVGEISRCAVLDKYDDIPFMQSLGTVVAERFIDTLAVLTLVVSALCLQWKIFYTFFISANDGSQTGAGFSATGISIISLSLISIAVLSYCIMKSSALSVKIKSLLRRFWEGFSVFGKMDEFPMFLIGTVAIWFCYFMQFYLCFFCFPFSSDLSLQAALLLFVAGSVAVVVPTPNGAGPWHFAIISMMMLYGVSQENAGLFAIIVHTSQTALVALLGIIGLTMIQFRKKTIFNHKHK